ncbi:DUF2865 domain-containing protein [Arsenicitalea aurantiaca]|nr:DUF2865 domain-containing protein [Arsenicitalea aurantiaca]
MLNTTRNALRMFLAIGAMGVLFATDMSAAHAQSASCAQLNASLQSLERNNDFRNSGSNDRRARDVQRSLQAAESTYVRSGCNDIARSGRQLPRQCQQLARQITSGREEYAALTQSVQTGSNVSQQREAILQEMARFGCNAGSNSRVVRQDQPGLFDRLFGGFTREGQGEGFSSDSNSQMRGGQFGGYGNYSTVRSLCVRRCDGFYWPISYSTVREYLQNDAMQCQQQCPGAEVELYYHDNPGQEPEQMVSLTGQPYTALPTAFRFRREYDKSCACGQQMNQGTIGIADVAGGGQSQASIAFGDANVPMPQRDPRGRIAPTNIEVAELISVPLPRRRPAAPGEVEPPHAVPAMADAANAQPRIVQFGERRVRVVGPNTPYVPEAEEES